MKQTLRLWGLEWKHMMKKLPAMLCTAAFLLALLGGTAFGAAKLLYRDSPFLQITIAVVEEEENVLTDMVIQYVEEMESISKSCRFLMTEKEEGFKMLEEGSVAAVLVLPGGMIEGILTGENIPAQVYFPKDAGVESALLKELTDAGMDMLRVAQAEIYGIYDTAAHYGVLEEIAVLEADINRYNLAFALDRLALYQTREVAATGELSILQYAAVSGGIFFLLLFGMACYPMMKPYPRAFRQLLKKQGIGIGAQCLGKGLCGFCAMGAGVCCLFLFAKGIAAAADSNAWLPILGVKQVGMLFLICLCATAFVFLIFQIADNAAAALLLLFFLTTVMTYCAGGFVPSVFLPETIRKIGGFLPVSYLIEAAGSLYLHDTPHRAAGALVIMTLLFAAASYAVRRGKEV
ncbi:MAG: ABC transporter permease [Muribaculaceae bacterium]|nr:ABC transporter permease [Muribaculaceae bacterium]